MTNRPVASGQQKKRDNSSDVHAACDHIEKLERLSPCKCQMGFKKMVLFKNDTQLLCIIATVTADSQKDPKSNLNILYIFSVAPTTCTVCNHIKYYREVLERGQKNRIKNENASMLNLSLYNTVPLWKSCLRPTVQYSPGTKESDKPVRHVFICFCSARSFRAGGVQCEAEDREKTLGVLGKSFCCGVPSQWE